MQAIFALNEPSPLCSWRRLYQLGSGYNCRTRKEMVNSHLMDLLGVELGVQSPRLLECLFCFFLNLSL